VLRKVDLIIPAPALTRLCLNVAFLVRQEILPESVQSDPMRHHAGPIRIRLSMIIRSSAMEARLVAIQSV